MRLLPSERESRIASVSIDFAIHNRLEIREPCNCGSNIRHISGGNYHQIITLARDGDQVFVKYDTTCDELDSEAEWESCMDWVSVVHKYADWL